MKCPRIVWENGVASIEAALKLLILVAIVAVPMASMSKRVDRPITDAAQVIGGGAQGSILDNETQGPAAVCDPGVPCAQPTPAPTLQPVPQLNE